jgi:L,D-transpeptidase ErfK/SrfK
MEHEMSSEGVKKTSLARGIFYLLIVVVVALGISALLANIVIDNSHRWGDKAVQFIPEPDPTTILSRVPADGLGNYKAKLMKELAAANKKLDANIPRQPYLVINTANNTFRLMKYNELIREGICSTGSYTILTGGDDQKWVFETPRGMLKVQGKQEAPVWVKPDWAFVEEGLPVPPPGHSSRYEKGVLGDYKLMLGKGYMIHGTIYKRFLGMNVTHGCVRLGDDDLEAVYKNLQIGSKVYIY